MSTDVRLGNKTVGDGFPVYIAGEIGINHNGDLETAKKLIDVAAFAGCDAVKFQKRTPELCVPLDMREVMRETPWGIMSYMDYRERIEFGAEEYEEIASYCRQKGIGWFASCWDMPSVDFIEQFDPIAYKVASASVTDHELLSHLSALGRTLVMSTGMSTIEQIDTALSVLADSEVLITHTTSAYPCRPNELNLKMIPTLKQRYGRPIGYSGHEVGLQTTYAAVVLGACYVERHITLDRAMWGSDHAASIEPAGLIRLVRDIRVIEQALGDGRKLVYDSELPLIKRLRRS
jgi:N-acetylneuraminate synthase